MASGGKTSIDVAKLPPYISRILQKSRLDRTDEHELRQFLYKHLSRGIDVEPFRNIVKEKYGEVQIDRIWTKRCDYILRSELKLRRNSVYEQPPAKESKASKQKKEVYELLMKPNNETVTLDEWCRYTNVLLPSEIPGCNLLPNGLYNLNDHGRKFLRATCHRMCRVGGEPMPFIKRLEKYFDSNLLCKTIDEKVIAGFSSAYEKFVKEQNDKSSVNNKETFWLNRLINCLDYRDIPGLETYNKNNAEGIDKTRLITDEGADWLKDRIRRMFQLQLQLDPFLGKLLQMFGMGVARVFTLEFKDEITSTLLSQFKGGDLLNLIHLEKLLSYAKPKANRESKVMKPRSPSPPMTSMHIDKLAQQFFAVDFVPIPTGSSLISIEQSIASEFYISNDPVFVDYPAFEKSYDNNVEEVSSERISNETTTLHQSVDDDAASICGLEYNNLSMHVLNNVEEESCPSAASWRCNNSQNTQFVYSIKSVDSSTVRHERFKRKDDAQQRNDGVRPSLSYQVPFPNKRRRVLLPGIYEPKRSNRTDFEQTQCFHTQNL